MKQKLLFLFILSVAIIATAFSQVADSISNKASRKFSVEVSVGVGNWIHLDKTYKDKQEYSYNETTVSSLIFKDKQTLSPSVKLGLNIEHNNFFSTVIGLKYFYRQISFDNTSHQYYNTSTYSTESFTSSQNRSTIHALQLSLGPKIFYKRSYFSVTVNLNAIKLKQQTKSYNIHSTTTSTSFSQDDSESLSRYNATGNGFGIGANLGYEFAIKKRALKLELQCDYLSPKFTGISDSRKEYLYAINTSFSIGIRFAKKQKKLANSDSVAKKPSQFSTEFSVGAGYLSYLNENFKNKRSETNIQHTISTFTNKSSSNKWSPILKISFNSQNRKHFNITWGFVYNYSQYNIFYSRNTFYNPPSTSENYYTLYQSSKNHNFQPFFGLKIKHGHFFLSSTLNLNTIIAVQNIYLSYGSKSFPTSIVTVPSGYSKSNYLTIGLGAGACVSIGYEFPMEKRVIILQLQCNYLLQPNESPIILHSINTAILVGFRF